MATQTKEVVVMTTPVETKKPAATTLVRVSGKANQVINLLSKRDGRSKAQIIEEALHAYARTYPEAREKVASRRGRKKKVA